MRLLILMFTLLFSLMMSMPAVAQDQPEEIDVALQDLGGRVGQPVTPTDVTTWTWQGRVYSDASLGCPQPGETYAQVQTPGYQFIVQYQGRNYDYRVAENGSSVVLCSVELVPTQPGDAAPPASDDSGGFECAPTWVVQPGDTLYSISRTCSTTVDALLAANPSIENRAFIRVGQEITIPDGTGDGEEPGQFAIAPTSGPPGTEVQLTAVGFQPNITINVGIGPVESEYDVIDTTQAGINGSVNTTAIVPDYADPEQEWVFVLAVPGTETRLISDVFDVTSGDEDDLAEFTSTDIYLIALDDGGQSGEAVGCGDSVIPVEVTFEPTVAPLTAALEAMFAIDTRFYGQSGLYNALYQSDLSVDGIDIDANRHATINLSGTLNIGGTCDAPRVEAQIEQTALQYNTIDTVDVFLNGEPLQDSL